jgi:hypothetical protein
VDKKIKTSRIRRGRKNKKSLILIIQFQIIKVLKSKTKSKRTSQVQDGILTSLKLKMMEIVFIDV